jgi:hypothetical protein
VRLLLWSEEDNRETELQGNERKLAPVNTDFGAAEKRGKL